MNSILKSFSCKNGRCEQIKIRTIKVSKNKYATSSKLQTNLSSTISEASSRLNNSTTSSNFSIVNPEISKSRLFFNSIIAQDKLFAGIQKINETLENEEDSLIGELTDLLDFQETYNPNMYPSSLEKHSKLSDMKIKLKKNHIHYNLKHKSQE